MYKSKQRKQLELVAILTNNTVTYSYQTPINPKLGDRWYNGKGWGYCIWKEHKEVGQTTPFWMIVSSSTFFDLTKHTS